MTITSQMKVKVFIDENEVFTGTLNKFLQDNDNDEWLVDECRKIHEQDVVEFEDFHTGKVRSEKVIE